MSENSGNGLFGGWHGVPLDRPVKAPTKPATPPADAQPEPDAEEADPPGES